MTALVDTMATATSFEPNVMGMVLNISHQGICMVVPFMEARQPEETCMVQIEGMPPVKAQVRWRLVIDPQVLKLGLLFYEERPVDIRRVKPENDKRQKR